MCELGTVRVIYPGSVAHDLISWLELSVKWKASQSRLWFASEEPCSHALAPTTMRAWPSGNVGDTKVVPWQRSRWELVVDSAFALKVWRARGIVQS